MHLGGKQLSRPQVAITQTLQEKQRFLDETTAALSQLREQYYANGSNGGSRVDNSSQVQSSAIAEDRQFEAPIVNSGSQDLQEILAVSTQPISDAPPILISSNPPEAEFSPEAQADEEAEAEPTGETDAQDVRHVHRLARARASIRV